MDVIRKLEGRLNAANALGKTEKAKARGFEHDRDTVVLKSMHLEAEVERARLDLADAQATVAGQQVGSFMCVYVKLSVRLSVMFLFKKLFKRNNFSILASYKRVEELTR
jgi:hypothetical protein